MAPGARNLMIFGAIARLRRSGSRFSGQNRPRSSEMRVYIKNKKSSKFQNFILVPGVRKTDFYDFSGIFLRKKIGLIVAEFLELPCTKSSFPDHRTTGRRPYIYPWCFNPSADYFLNSLIIFVDDIYVLSMSI